MNSFGYNNSAVQQQDNQQHVNVVPEFVINYSSNDGGMVFINNLSMDQFRDIYDYLDAKVGRDNFRFNGSSDWGGTFQIEFCMRIFLGDFIDEIFRE